MCFVWRWAMLGIRFLRFYLKWGFWDFSPLPQHMACFSIFHLYMNHIEVPRWVKCQWSLIWFSSAAKKKKPSVILAKASMSLSCSQVVFRGFQGSSRVSSLPTHTLMNIQRRIHSSAGYFSSVLHYILMSSVVQAACVSPQHTGFTSWVDYHCKSVS